MRAQPDLVERIVPISAPFTGALLCDGYPRRAEENPASRRSCPGLPYTRALAALLRHGSITHRTVRHPRKTRIWPRRWRTVPRLFSLWAWALIVTTRVQGREKARGRGCHCTYLEGFISITASDCGKALDKVPEEHGMRSTKTTNDQAMTELVMPE